jgi:hypothetical protein
MPRRKRLDISKAIGKLETAETRAAEATAALADKDPLRAALKIEEALERWQQDGPAEYTRDDKAFGSFVRYSARQLLGEVLTTLRESNKLLYKKLQSDPDMSTKEMAEIAGHASRVASILQKLEKDQPALPTASELDEEIAALEARLKGQVDEPNRTEQ